MVRVVLVVALFALGAQGAGDPFEEGMALVREQNCDAAIPKLEQAVRRAPNAVAYLQLGNCYRKRKEYGKAERSYQLAVEHAVDDEQRDRFARLLETAMREGREAAKAGAGGKAGGEQPPAVVKPIDKEAAAKATEEAERATAVGAAARAEKAQKETAVKAARAEAARLAAAEAARKAADKEAAAEAAKKIEKEAAAWAAKEEAARVAAAEAERRAAEKEAAEKEEADRVAAAEAARKSAAKAAAEKAAREEAARLALAEKVAAEQAARDEAERLRRPAPLRFVAGGAAVVAAGVAVGFHLSAQSDADAIAGTVHPAAEAVALADSVKSKSTKSTLLLGAAGVLAVASAVLFVVRF